MALACLQQHVSNFLALAVKAALCQPGMTDMAGSALGGVDSSRYLSHMVCPYEQQGLVQEGIPGHADLARPVLSPYLL